MNVDRQGTDRKRSFSLSGDPTERHPQAPESKCTLSGKMTPGMHLTFERDKESGDSLECLNVRTARIFIIYELRGTTRNRGLLGPRLIIDASRIPALGPPR